MKKKVIGILDREAAYAARLMEVFNSRNRMGFQAEMFTGVDSFLEYSRKNAVEILLVGESLMVKGLHNMAKLVIVISEGSRVAETEEYEVVYKYQSSELIIRKVLECYSSVGSGAQLLCRTDTRIYGVYAPQGRICRSRFAWNLAKYFSQHESVLYIGLHAFQIRRELYDGSKDLADIMYYIRNGFENLIYLVGSSVTSQEGIDCLPAIQSVDDLVQVPCEDWLKLLQTIAVESNYDAVVVEVEECVQQFYQILDYCTEVYMPYVESRRHEGKWNLCKEYFKKVGAEDVWKQAKILQVDSNCWRCDMESILNK